MAEELHFGRAAERLHVAQPPLSRTIQRLERDLGTQLFDRTTRSVRLTPAGEAFVGPARDILDDCRVGRAAVSAASAGEVGRLRIGFAGPSSHTLIAKLARLMRQEHPGIELSLQSTTYGKEALRKVVDRSLDVAIVRWSVAPPGICSRVVREEHYVLAVPESHRLAGRRSVSMVELRDEAFIALPADPGSNVRDDFVRLCYEAGYAPNIVQVAPDSWTIMALVAAEVGITMTIDTAAEHILDEGIAIVPLAEGNTAVHARLAWRQDDVGPALERLLDVSRRALPSPQPSSE